MRTPLEIRNDAMDCLRQAGRADARRHKAVLLLLAQGWASLADEMERRGLGPSLDPTEAGDGDSEKGQALQPAGAN